MTRTVAARVCSLPAGAEVVVARTAAARVCGLPVETEAVATRTVAAHRAAAAAASTRRGLLPRQGLPGLHQGLFSQAFIEAFSLADRRLGGRRQATTRLRGRRRRYATALPGQLLRQDDASDKRRLVSGTDDAGILQRPSDGCLGQATLLPDSASAQRPATLAPRSSPRAAASARRRLGSEAGDAGTSWGISGGCIGR